MKTGTYLNINTHHLEDTGTVFNLKKGNLKDNIAKECVQLNNIFGLDSAALFLKVNTDLMEEEGIFLNDILVIDPGRQSVNGNIVVASVNEDLMVRRYEKIKSGHLLYGDTKKISPLKIEEGYDQFKILGIVAYIIKSML